MLVSRAPVGQDPAETLVRASIPAAPGSVVPETRAGRVRGDGSAQASLRGHLSRKKGICWRGVPGGAVGRLRWLVVRGLCHGVQRVPTDCKSCSGQRAFPTSPRAMTRAHLSFPGTPRTFL